MRTVKIFCGFLLLLTIALPARAQDNSGFSSTVNWFYSACEDRMVIDFNGSIQLGYDLYYQAFDAFGGLGNAITGLRRISVNGDYALSQVIYWSDFQTRALNTPISVVIRIGRENDPDSTIFQTPSDDYLTACEEPGSTLVEGSDLSAVAEVTSTSGVFTPDGGLLNPVFAPPNEPIVRIGARTPQNTVEGRMADPGLIFAECADTEGAAPGLLYDNDNIRVFWSWYAKTAAQVQDHIDTAQYNVTLHNLLIPNVQRSEIKQVPGSINWWVFYTVNLGDKWKPGSYHINYAVNWTEEISDGYDSFGPGTENVRLDSGCPFTIVTNPYGIAVLHEQPAIPLKTYP